ncbi:methionyl-tRNA formyltransferase [Clostridium intestinale]|uniref:Methionyl-tRNA formyltransferase n=1 Tax=Clostridium intestinale TaxID=36845 RepID=A0A7D6W3L4_9CLOT|nr:methionyl-tRNA formyltransferase [Clostridium intestinale]QLY81971.1 methionyl-tRNA formyltransferase [Clostridium intestinale]
MKIVFMGTPDFAVPSLKALIENHQVEAVFTQPDKPKGRGKKLSVSPVKEEALKHSIKVYQPEKIKNNEEHIKALKDIDPDYIIVVAYGQILTKEILDIPKYACINLHASILPKFRGAAPINWAVINGEKYSGNTTMLMDVGLDTGDMLLKDEVEITPYMTAGELHDVLMDKGAGLLLDTIKGYTNNEITPMKQDDSLSSYASMLNKEIAKIDWNKTALEIHNMIRGLNPWPIAYTTYKEQNMKIFKSEVIDEDKTSEDIGKIIDVSKDGIKVSCGKGILLIKRVQFPNGKPLDISQYLNGNEIEKNIIIGK